MSVRVVGPRDAVSPDELVISTVSKSDNWSRGLSPFFLGPIPLYDGAIAKESVNMENAWQFAKCYPWHVTHDGKPTVSYFEWAKAGWQDSHAHRYPFGKGRKPEFLWWAGEKLDYVTARKKVYIPLYARAVVNTRAFRNLLEIYKKNGNVTLWDFDGYDHISLGMTLKEVINDPNKKCGHAFVLAHLLESMNGSQKI